MITFKLEGLKELDAALGELSKATASNTLYRALQPAAELLDQTWRDNAPELTGGLKRSGGIVKSSAETGDAAFRAAKRQGADSAGAVQAKRDALRGSAADRSFAELTVGPGRAPKAIQQEFGNRDMAAQPYFRPAYESTKERMLNIITSGLTYAVSGAVERARRKALKAKG
ncbi:MAG TPA: HK97-gp10 family putative phage morphogenesis protein [Caulobacteraceae bacterium]|jgi:HK97 gp10 family phage protein|nr:HK97-gp10 family putative phage morphogenesis protein [Caulobacteraceae bacterium]